MPYEYRKLSQGEREKVVNFRRERGYPLHAPPHPFREAGAYLISAANFEHKPILKSPERRTELEARLLEAAREIAKEIIAWAILPNHYHILLHIQSLNHVSAALQHLYGVTSREWNIEDNLTGKRRVWYKFTDTYIRNEAHLHLAFNYIHYNPVKHGYTKDAYEWHWSSLPLYYKDMGRDWLRSHWQAYTLPADFGKGWDDDIVND